MPLLCGCHLSVLDPAGPVSEAQHTILLNSLVIMLCIIVPIMAATVLFAWWFRSSNVKARRLPEWSFSGRIEIVTWSVPLMTIIFLGGIAWIGSHDLDPAKPLEGGSKPLEVQVVSLDWKWLFIYPDHRVASLNQLILPTATPVHFRLTSSSVWNSFFVPRLGSMIYTMNGMTTELNLQADEEGEFYGLSTHLSGDGFSDMHFQTKAVSSHAFAEWVKAAQGSSEALDDTEYQALTKQSTIPPRTYRVSDGDLFNKIVSQALPPGPGPDAGQPSTNIAHRQGS